MPVLFLCSTPLQCLIAEALIERNGHTREECSLFYFSWVRNPKVEHYFRRLAARCGESVFHSCATGYPRNLLETRRHFQGRRFERVYCACTNSPYVQLALSTVEAAAIETFDDGTANLSLDGAYAQRYGMSFLRFLSAWVLGNRMPQYRIRAQSRRHYTVFRAARNVAMAPLEFVDIFRVPSLPPAGGECHVLLGTVLAEALDGAAAEVAARLQAFAAGLEGEVFYVPHPRGEPLPALEALTLHTQHIAEDILAELLGRYARVHVYGFASSAQFVAAACPRITNGCYDLPELKPGLRGVAARGVREFGMHWQRL